MLGSRKGVVCVKQMALCVWSKWPEFTIVKIWILKKNCIHGVQMINEFAARIVNTGPRDNIPNLKDMFESLLLSRRQIWWFFPETVHY